MKKSLREGIEMTVKGVGAALMAAAVFTIFEIVGIVDTEIMNGIVMPFNFTSMIIRYSIQFAGGALIFVLPGIIKKYFE